MTNVTALTKELVEQFEFVVGRRVTAAEYMDLRKQAIFELGSGYSIPSSQPDMSRPIIPEFTLQQSMISVPYNYAQSPAYVNNYAQNTVAGNPNAIQSVQKSVELQENEQNVQPITTQQPVNANPIVDAQPSVAEQPVAPVETKQSTSTAAPTPVSNTATNQTATIKPVVAQIAKENDNSNDFFKLVGKFMQ